MPKTRKSVVTEKYQKCLGEQLHNNSINLHFLPKNHRSAVMEKCLKLKVLCSQKNAKIPQCLQSQKMPKTCKFAITKKIPEMRRSAVMQKCEKLIGLQSRKNSKYSQVCGHGKYQKCVSAVMQNATNSQVHNQGKMPKTRWSAVTKKMPKTRRSMVTEKCLKLTSQRSHKLTSPW